MQAIDVFFPPETYFLLRLNNLLVFLNISETGTSWDWRQKCPNKTILKWININKCHKGFSCHFADQEDSSQSISVSWDLCENLLIYGLGALHPYVHAWFHCRSFSFTQMDPPPPPPFPLAGRKKRPWFTNLVGELFHCFTNQNFRKSGFK